MTISYFTVYFYFFVSTTSSNRLWIYLSSASYCACLIANGLLNYLNKNSIFDWGVTFLFNLPLTKYLSREAFPYPVGIEGNPYD